MENVFREGFFRSDDDLIFCGVDLENVERVVVIVVTAANAETFALADGEMDDAVMLAEHAAVDMHDLAGLLGFRANFFHDFCVVAAGDEADILRVRFVGGEQTKPFGVLARDVFCPAAQRKPQEIQLFLRGGEQEIALVFCVVDCAVEFGGPIVFLVAVHALHVVAGHHAVGAEIVRDAEQVAEFDGLIAAHARDGCFAAHVAVGEIVDHRLAEIAFVIQDVVREAARIGHAAGIVDVLAGAAGFGFRGGRAVIVELQRYADDVVAVLVQQARGDGGIDPARHAHDPAGGLRFLCYAERVFRHGGEYRARGAGKANKGGGGCKPLGLQGDLNSPVRSRLPGGGGRGRFCKGLILKGDPNSAWPDSGGVGVQGAEFMGETELLIRRFSGEGVGAPFGFEFRAMGEG